MTEIKINLEILNKPDDEKRGVLLQVLGLSVLANTMLDRNSEACKWAEAKVEELILLIDLYPDHLGCLSEFAGELIDRIDRDDEKHHLASGEGFKLLLKASLAQDMPAPHIPPDEELMSLVRQRSAK